MNSAPTHRPPAVYLLWLLLLFQTLSGLYGGIVLIADPTGGILHMPLEPLEGTPFSDYLVPGIVLFLLLGVLPAVLLYALPVQPAWPGAGILNAYHDMYWAWTYALYVGIILVIWMDVQIFFIGYGHAIQTVYAAVGIGIVIAALLPPVREYYRHYPG